MFNISLAVLQAMEGQLLESDMTEIQELFKGCKEEPQFPVEMLIENAQRIYIPNERLKTLFAKYKINIKKERQNSRKTFTTEKAYSIILNLLL